MTHLTREVIEERVRIFVDSVRDGVESFKPGITWWLVKETKASQEKYPDSILLLDQLGILEDDMKNIARLTGPVRSATARLGMCYGRGRISVLTLSQ